MKRVMENLLTDQSQDFKIKTIEEMVDYEINQYNQEKGSLEHFDCDICLNKGYIAIPNESNDSMILEKCECFPKREFNRRMAYNGMQNLTNTRINDYMTDMPFQQVVKKLAIEYLTTENNLYWFALFGMSGSGKTMIITAIANKLMADGMEVRYVSWVDFKDKVKKESLGDSGSIELSKAKRCEVLVIDDLFKGKTTEADENIAYQLINHRYNNHLITLISSELFIEEFKGENVATIGRIRERCGKFIAEIDRKPEYNFRSDVKRL